MRYPASGERAGSPEPFKGYQPSAQTAPPPEPFKGYQPPAQTPPPEPYKGYQPAAASAPDADHGSRYATNPYQPVGPSGPASNPRESSYLQQPRFHEPGPYEANYPEPPTLPPPYPRYYDTDDVDYYEYGRQPAAVGPEYDDITFPSPGTAACPLSPPPKMHANLRQ